MAQLWVGNALSVRFAPREKLHTVGNKVYETIFRVSSNRSTILNQEVAIWIFC